MHIRLYYASARILRACDVRDRSSCNKSVRSFILIAKRQLISKGKCGNIPVARDSMIDLYLQLASVENGANIRVFI